MTIAACAMHKTRLGCSRRYCPEYTLLILIDISRLISYGVFPPPKERKNRTTRATHSQHTKHERIDGQRHAKVHKRRMEIEPLEPEGREHEDRQPHLTTQGQQGYEGGREVRVISHRPSSPWEGMP